MRQIFLVLLFICFSVKAEVYKDFVPYTSVAQMKARYPNAKLEIVKAAWVRENDRFFKITGEGLAGTTFVATSKLSDEYYRQKIERLKAYIVEHPEEDTTFYQNSIAFSEKTLVLPDDERYTIDWLRWVPDVPIPLERVKAKFGEPSKYDFSESDFQPYAEWSTKGLHVNLSDDKKMVYSIEYTFTDEENNRALGIEPAPAQEEKPAPKKSRGKSKAK